jgi:hypothetical protein
MDPQQAEYMLGSEVQQLTMIMCGHLESIFCCHSASHATGKILTSAALHKPLEAAYQDGVYRCFNVVAGRGVPTCSEWSRTKEGRVDFWIPEKKWAVELSKRRIGSMNIYHVSRRGAVTTPG